MRPRIGMVYPALPPIVDGVADYTARLARELANDVDVLLFTCADPRHLPVTDVTVIPLPGMVGVCGLLRTLRALLRQRPASVIWQYTPFTYGRRGLALAWAFFPALCAIIRVPVVTIFHECYVEADSVGIRTLVWGIVQRLEYYAILSLSSGAIFTTQSRLDRACRTKWWAPPQRFLFAGVPSNIPVAHGADSDIAALRRRFGLSDDDYILATFGLHHERSWTYRLVRALASPALSALPVKVLMLGGHGTAAGRDFIDRQAMSQGVADRLVWTGYLSAHELSCALRMIHVALALYNGGMSSRRGTAAAFLEHGCCIVASLGIETDERTYRKAIDSILVPPTTSALAKSIAMVLTDESLRRHLGAGAAARYAEIQSWSFVANQVRNVLVNCGIDIVSAKHDLVPPVSYEEHASLC